MDLGAEVKEAANKSRKNSALLVDCHRMVRSQLTALHEINLILKLFSDLCDWLMLSVAVSVAEQQQVQGKAEEESGAGGTSSFVSKLIY